MSDRKSYFDLWVVDQRQQPGDEPLSRQRLEQMFWKASRTQQDNPFPDELEALRSIVLELIRDRVRQPVARQYLGELSCCTNCDGLFCPD
jgi:hypothetical protein